VKHLTTISLVFLLTLSLALPALAVDPLGPPRNDLEQGQWSLGAVASSGYEDYEGRIYSSAFSGNEVIKINNLKTKKYLARIGYGPDEYWDIFAEMGTTSHSIGNVDGEDDPIVDHLSGTDSDLSYGAGIRFTIKQYEDIVWGGIARIGYSYSDFDEQAFKMSGCLNPSVRGKIDLFTAQLVVGPTVKITEDCSLYGGGFWNYGSGELKYSYERVFSATQNETADLKHSSFGLMGGALVRVKKAGVNLDGHVLSDGGYGATMGVIFPFSKGRN